MVTTLEQLRVLMIPEIQKIFLEVMQDIVDRAILGEMIAAIEANDPEALFKATGFTPAALGPILDAIERTYEDAAGITVDGWPKRIRTPLGTTVFRFDIRNPRVEDDLRNFSSAYITRLTNEAREVVRETMQRGFVAGDNPRKTALDIVGRVDPTTKKRVGGVIGLSAPQERWVASGRRYLEDLDARYFGMGLRDKRFDSIVKRAIDEGKALPPEKVTQIMTAYKNRALKYRADTIARTETIQSINRGEYAAHLQAVADGVLQASAITKHWDDVGDLRTRTTHSVMGTKYKTKGIGLEEPFVSPSGARMRYPGDSSMGAPGEEIINCRCKAFYKVDFLAGVE